MNEPTDAGVLALVAEIVGDEVPHGPILDAELVDDDEHQAHAELVELDVLDGDALIDEWLDKHKDSPHTHEAYGRDIRYWRTYLTEVLDGDVMLAQGRDVERYQLWLTRTPLPSTGKVPAPSTVRRRVEVVSSFYRWAVKREYLPRNPADFVDRVKVDPDHSDTSSLTEDEAIRVIDEAFGRTAKLSYPDRKRVAERDALIVAVMCTTGLRTSEVRALRVEDLGYDSGYRVAKVIRKGKKPGVVVLGPAAEMVDRYVQAHGWTEGPLFRTRSGAPVPRSWVFESLRLVAVAAAVPDPHRITPHGLRHTYVTLALDAGVPLGDVQAGVGHADPRTTQRYDRNRKRLHNSPTHVVGPALLKKDKDKTGRLPF